MRYVKVLSSVTAVGLLVGAVFLATPTNAKQPTELEVKEAVENYFAAVKSGNVDAVMGLTVDKRYKSDLEKQRVYTNLLNEDHQADGKVLDVQMIDASHAKVAVRAKTKIAGEHDIVLPVVKESASWKIVIEGIKVKGINVE